MSTSILDLDDYLDGNNSETEVLNKPFRKANKDTKLPKAVSTMNPKDNPESIGTVSDSLTKNAKKRIEYYLQKSPQLQVLQKQLDILKTEAKEYKTHGLDDLYGKTIEMIQELTKKAHSFIKLYKNNNWEKDKTTAETAIKNSEVLKALKKERTLLTEEYRKINPNSVMYDMKLYRNVLGIQSNDGEIDYSFDESEEIQDLDDVVDKLPTNEVKQEYNDLCGYLADVLDIMPSEIYTMKISDLVKLLKNDKTCQDRIKEIQDKLDRNRVNNQKEISSLKGHNDITNVIYDIFDFETTPEQQPKELLAAANVPYVKAIAYNMCVKVNGLQNIDDAIAYGLLGLSLAVNKWYNLQKLEDSALSFSGFSHTYIVGSIKKGLWELGSGGMLNKSSMATLETERTKLRAAFLKSNPELKDLPDEMLESFVESIMGDKLMPNVTTESEYSSTVGGDEGDNADIWANANSGGDDAKFIETKMEYETLLKSIKNLFNLFETKIDKISGEEYVTNNKIFDRYDYKLFKLYFGLEFKREATLSSGSSISNKYTQEEIAQIFADYYAVNGIKKTFSQAAINYRIQTLLEKIKESIDKNPGIKAGFEYIYNTCQANSEMINYFSNNREEIEIKMNRDELKEVYADDNDELTRKLSDGKTLSDIYQVNSDNMFDEEIANSFSIKN